MLSLLLLWLLLLLSLLVLTVVAVVVVVIIVIIINITINIPNIPKYCWPASCILGGWALRVGAEAVELDPGAVAAFGTIKTGAFKTLRIKTYRGSEDFLTNNLMLRTFTLVALILDIQKVNESIGFRKS